jgi:glutathione peroxidase
MRTMAGILMLMAATAALSSDGSLLDQDFRRLASDEVVNLEAAYGGKVVLGFPSNDFFGQEPGTEEEIQEFCRLTYGVRFPMFEKVTVKEGEAHPFYARLAEAAGTYPTWNFHKYLIGRDGRLIAEFSPRTKPYDATLVSSIEDALAL